MKITQSIHNHFKRNLGDDYIRFYTGWIAWTLGAGAVYFALAYALTKAVNR